MAQVTTISEDDLGGAPAMAVPIEPAEENFPSADVRRGCALGLFSVGLPEFWTINVLKVHSLRSAVVIDGKPIAFMHRDDPHSHIRP